MLHFFGAPARFNYADVQDAVVHAGCAPRAYFGRRALLARAREAAAGQVVDLGGGVFKKRLNRNFHRGIILAKGGRVWFYEYQASGRQRVGAVLEGDMS